MADSEESLETCVLNLASRPARAWRGWGIIGLGAQAAFMLGWLAAEAWQPRGYSWLSNTIGDMQAATAPHVWLLVLCFAVGGAGSFCFLIFGLRPTLRPAGAVAAGVPWAMALSLLALGNSFPLMPCQVGPACSPHQQLFGAGGYIDAILASVALFVVSFSPKHLWRRLRAVPGWKPFKPVAARAATVAPAAFLLFCLSSLTGVAEGLTERMVVTACAVWMAALAWAWLRIAPIPRSTFSVADAHVRLRAFRAALRGVGESVRAGLRSLRGALGR
jgi:hypothetical protein